MNKYEDLLQAAEPVKNLLREQYDPMCEIRITFDRVDILRGEMGLPFEAARQEAGSGFRQPPVQTGRRITAETALRGCRAGADRPAPDDGRSSDRK